MSWSLPDLPTTGAPNRSDRIYTDFFCLRGTPFSITPDPEFLFLSDAHQSVIEKIQYGIQGRMGFMLLAGEVGTGKTTLCRALLDQLQGHARTVYVINPALNGRELLACILEDLGVAYLPSASKKELIDQLNRFLLADQNAGPVVIIIDDAQTMPLETLEDLRLLSNLETDKSKLLQMLLVGQPELLVQLDRPEMRQIKQRVAVYCLLAFLAPNEAAGYIERRLSVAGNQGQVRFAPKAVRKIHHYSDGVPRMINKICDLALTAAYAANSHTVEVGHVAAACEELIEAKSRRLGSMRRAAGWRGLPRRMALTTVGVAVLGMALRYGGYDYLVQATTDLWPTHDQRSTCLSTLPEKPKEDGPPSSTQTGPGPYILQLGSYNTLASTLRAIDFYGQKAIPVHWSPIDRGGKGGLYRVFTGRHLSVQQARQYQQDKGLTEATVLLAPWTVALGPVASAEAIQAWVQPLGLDYYPVRGRDGRDLLVTGAFETRESAQPLAAHIEQQTGNAVEVAECGPLPIALQSGATFEKGGPSS